MHSIALEISIILLLIFFMFLLLNEVMYLNSIVEQKILTIDSLQCKPLI